MDNEFPEYLIAFAALGLLVALMVFLPRMTGVDWGDPKRTAAFAAWLQQYAAARGMTHGATPPPWVLAFEGPGQSLRLVAHGVRDGVPIAVILTTKSARAGERVTVVARPVAAPAVAHVQVCSHAVLDPITRSMMTAQPIASGEPTFDARYTIVAEDPREALVFANPGVRALINAFPPVITQLGWDRAQVLLRWNGWEEDAARLDAAVQLAITASRFGAH